MKTTIDYEMLKTEALSEIVGMMNPHSKDIGQLPDESLEAMNSTIMDVAHDFERFNWKLEKVKKITYELLQNIIVILMQNYKVDFKNFVIPGFSKLKVAPIFTLRVIENEKPILYYFKEFGLQNTPSLQIMNELLDKTDFAEYKLISLVENKAYAELFDYKRDNSEDKGTNIYSLKYFFERYFNEDEWIAFKAFEEDYMKMIRKCFGYKTVKTLLPNTMNGFKRIVDTKLRTFDYYKNSVSKCFDTDPESGIDETQYQYIYEQFIRKKQYMAMLGKKNFASSLVTSEWLKESLNGAEGIDLTAIAMGYFKSVEQLLYEYIILHKNQRRKIKKINKKETESLPQYIWLDTNSIENNHIDTMLNSMIGFLNYYKQDDLYRPGITPETKKYIIKTLRNAKNLRNGYFHKDNLDDWDVVKEARKKAYLVYFFMLGAFEYSEDDKISFDIPSYKEEHFFNLCDYIHYHKKVIYFTSDEGKKVVASTHPCDDVKYDKYGNAEYSGVYLTTYPDIEQERIILSKNLPKSGIKMNIEKVIFDIENIPSEIYEGEIKPCPEGLMFTGPERLIWKDGFFTIDNQEEIDTY